MTKTEIEKLIASMLLAHVEEHSLEDKGRLTEIAISGITPQIKLGEEMLSIPMDKEPTGHYSAEDERDAPQAKPVRYGAMLDVPYGGEHIIVTLKKLKLVVPFGRNSEVVLPFPEGTTIEQARAACREDFLTLVDYTTGEKI